MKRQLNLRDYPAVGDEPRELNWPIPFSADAFEAGNEAIFNRMYSHNKSSNDCEKRVAYVLLFLWPGSPVHSLPGPKRSIEAAKMAGIIPPTVQSIMLPRDMEGDADYAEALEIMTFADFQTKAYYDAYNALRVNAAARMLDYGASFEAALFHRALNEINSEVSKKEAWLEAKDAPKYVDMFHESASKWGEKYLKVFKAEEARTLKEQQEIDSMAPSEHEKSISGEADSSLNQKSTTQHGL